MTSPKWADFLQTGNFSLPGDTKLQQSADKPLGATQHTDYKVSDQFRIPKNDIFFNMK